MNLEGWNNAASPPKPEREMAVCHYCNGTGVEPRYEWQPKSYQPKDIMGCDLPDDEQPCFGCRGKKEVPVCQFCKVPYMVKCATCTKEFELKPWCLSHVLPLVGAHIRRSPGCLCKSVGDVNYDFCSRECMDKWTAPLTS